MRNLVDGRLSLLQLFLFLRLLLLFEHVFFTAIRGVCPGLPAWKGGAHPAHVVVLLILFLHFLLGLHASQQIPSILTSLNRFTAKVGHGLRP